MSDKFTPLTIGMLASGDPAVAGGAMAPAAAPKVTPFAALPLAGGAASGPRVCAKPEVTLVRNASGVVTSIRVQCGCGQVTELNCVY